MICLLYQNTILSIICRNWISQIESFRRLRQIWWKWISWLWNRRRKMISKFSYCCLLQFFFVCFNFEQHIQMLTTTHIQIYTHTHPFQETDRHIYFNFQQEEKLCHTILNSETFYEQINELLNEHWIGKNSGKDEKYLTQ